MVDASVLFESKDDIQSFINENFISILTTLNRAERLDDFFEMIGMPNPFNMERVWKPSKRGKVVVLGQSSISKTDMLVSAGKMGFDKSRFEFHLDYDEMKNMRIDNYKYKDCYCAILVGPMPHSGVGKGDFSSMITAMENGEGYPSIIKMGKNELKITKSAFQSALQFLIDNRIVEKNFNVDERGKRI